MAINLLHTPEEEARAELWVVSEVQRGSPPPGVFLT
jgi:hypothetical protein